MPILATALQESFARRRVMAMTGQIAAEAAVDTLLSVRAPGEGVTRRPREEASRLMTMPAVQARIRELMDAHDERQSRAIQRSADHMDLAELRAYLATLIRRPVGEVDETSPWAQEVTTEQLGKGRSRRKVKMPGKLEGATLLARLNGWLSDMTIGAALPGFERPLERPIGPAAPMLAATAPTMDLDGVTVAAQDAEREGAEH